MKIVPLKTSLASSHIVNTVNNEKGQEIALTERKENQRSKRMKGKHQQLKK